MVVGPDFTERRGKFFAQVFGKHEGYLCVAKKRPHNRGMVENFFRYPDQLDEALFWIDEAVPNHDLYFCAQLLTTTKRVKENIREVSVLWADLDPCPPAKMKLEPSFSIETSPGRYQALWRLDEPIDAFDGEDICHRIYYWHKADGVDSGWALTKYLRIPFTYNLKYGPPHPVVNIAAIKQGYYRADDFKVYDPIPGAASVSPNGSVPLTISTGAEAIEQNRFRLSDRAVMLFENEPDESQKEGWSGALWALIMECAEAGLDIEQGFAVARDSACNKYERDGRPLEALWKEVQKAYAKVAAHTEAIVSVIHKPTQLIGDDYQKPDSFIERYITWAKAQTDAASIYHQAGAFMILSAALSGMIVVPTSDRSEGERLNLWIMLLADTTLTRKSTSMRMAIRLLEEVVPDAVAATEATIEGLFTTMAARSGKPSIFLRDEFSGMLESMQKKEYYAGMAELLTQLYDGYGLQRQLARATVTITDPLLLLFVGGAKTRIFELLNEEFIRSGFLPRFLFFAAESDVKNYRPLGPPTEESDEARDELSAELASIVTKYQQMESLRMPVGNATVPTRPQQKQWKAILTPEAWERYNNLEITLVNDGRLSGEPELVTPMYQRLGKSILKSACLLAATRPENPSDGKVSVTESDIEHAISYGAGWRDSTLEVLGGAGASAYESQLKKVMAFLYGRQRNGALRSTIMRSFKLNAKDADALFATLEGRAMIRRVRTTNDWMIMPTGV